MSNQQYPIVTLEDTKAVATIRKLVPVKTNSIANHRQFSQDQIRQDAADTRIIVHHKYPDLVEAFLLHKRTHGSATERSFYGRPQTWTWQQQVARLVEKRSLVFMGTSDHTVLRDGRMIGPLHKEWDRVGTDAEVTSKYLTLKEYLSYDEMLLGSLLGVSGPSYFINDGSRFNHAKPGKPGTFEERGVVVGLVGARFERDDRMDSIFMLPPVSNPRQHQDLTTIFAKFFGKEVKLGKSGSFKHGTYKARMRIAIDILLFEADERAKTANKQAYVHIVGLGLGVWQVDAEQPEAYLEGFMDALDDFGHKLQNIGTLDFAYIEVAAATKHQMKSIAATRGIDAIFSRRNHADKLPPVKQDELLVVSYAWDSNAFPGNEYWQGALSASGDPAAACMSTIGELHNPVLNPQFLGKIRTLGQ